MTRFRFVHAADLHLDTPFDGLARLGASVPEVLRDASLRAWDNLVAETIRQDAAFLVLAGDVYDGPQRGLRAQLRFRDGLERLSAAGIRVFMVHGNHDPVDEGWSAIRDWPEGVHVFATDAVEAVPVEVAGERAATVHGISFARRDTTENLARRFPERSDGGFAVGVLHCNVGSNGEHAAYAPCELDDLRASGMDYWALGHIHRHQVLSREGPCAVYSGVLQGRSPKPSETGAKGAVVVDVEDGRVRDLRFRPLDVVRFETLELDVADIEDAGQLREALAGRAADLRSDAGDRQLVLRAALTGRGPVHEALRAGGQGAHDLLRDLRESQGDAGAWWDRLDDRTAPPLDLDAIRQRGDFSAELLRYADALLADERALEDFLSAACTPNDHRLRGLFDGPDAAGQRATLERAVVEALDRLERGEES